MAESPAPSNVGGTYERKAEQAENQAQKYREQAEQQRQFVDQFENMVLLLAQLAEQLSALTHISNAPKYVERNDKGKPVRIING